MICIKNLRFSSRQRANVRRQGPLGSARVQLYGGSTVGVKSFKLSSLLSFL